MHAAIGIMQGRLSPPVGATIQAFPRGEWEEEFARARQAGLDYVEWIFDLEDEANPIAHAKGQERMRELMDANGVSIPALCADYFMSKPLLHGTPEERQSRIEKLRLLLRQCAAVGVQRVILPFVDQSRIEGAGQSENLVALLKSLVPILGDMGIEIHLETSLAPRDFADLVNQVDSASIAINYDTGNSASLGYDPVEEFAAYGARIGSVHIKDRELRGGTVSLGSGAADFTRVAKLLRNAGYTGGYTLQAARGTSGDEVALAKANAAFWRQHLEAS